MKTRKTNGRNSRHDEWEFEKYSDRELVEAIREEIIDSDERRYGVVPIYKILTRRLCQEAIRRIEKYRMEANSYRRKYRESERRANWTYTPEQFGEIARM